MEPHKKMVFFAHGLESGPWGSKIKYLANIAENQGFRVESPDYSGMKDPQARVNKLVPLVPQDLDCLILVGSSMGGWVSLKASAQLKPDALFLLAPAVYMGYRMEEKFEEAPPPEARWVDIVHGWHDETVPVENVIRYAQEHQLRLHLLNSGHRLIDQLTVIGELFAIFLDEASQETERTINPE